PFPGRRLPQAYAMAAVLLLALGLGLLGWNFSLQREVRQLRSDVSRLATERDEALAVSNLSATGAVAGQAATGEVMYLRERRQAIVMVNNLPPLQPGQVYQIWLIAGGVPEGAGVLNAPSGGAMVQGDVTRYQRLAITIEPGPNGSATPTSPPVLAGALNLD
ncbi:MAG: anti-sigma factor, partial [Chloroflexota bacterium]|nr:anti-sigma factor [Chloroflexota bacterium]